MKQIYYDTLYCRDNVVPESMRKNESQNRVSISSGAQGFKTPFYSLSTPHQWGGPPPNCDLIADIICPEAGSGEGSCHRDYTWRWCPQDLGERTSRATYWSLRSGVLSATSRFLKVRRGP
ncbi:hypothetical protein Celaphus_00009159 [Cervus elaphus hippelaphus]|uniref:Uncharacterized protein n=1 Tax=Cervus elaphus hippelaphus TaxID=46360 RepID=A0A212DIY0_CEREH|nr:hypothetical protein Celaphus_00009159 [Cervus elaphus hippelaphus]